MRCPAAAPPARQERQQHDRWRRRPRDRSGDQGLGRRARGNVSAASERFAIPSSRMGPPLRLTAEASRGLQSLAALRRALTEAVAVDRFTIATFKLTERPGPGECGKAWGRPPDRLRRPQGTDHAVAPRRRHREGRRRLRPGHLSAHPLDHRTVNSVVPAWPFRSGVRTPDAAVSITAS